MDFSEVQIGVLLIASLRRLRPFLTYFYFNLCYLVSMKVDLTRRKAPTLRKKLRTPDHKKPDYKKSIINDYKKSH